MIPCDPVLMWPWLVKCRLKSQGSTLRKALYGDNRRHEPLNLLPPCPPPSLPPSSLSSFLCIYLASYPSIYRSLLLLSSSQDECTRHDAGSICDSTFLIFSHLSWKWVILIRGLGMPSLLLVWTSIAFVFFRLFWQVVVLREGWHTLSLQLLSKW